MNIEHHGNWPVIGKFRAEVGGVAATWMVDVFECPLCFALTREPMCHVDTVHLDRTEAARRRGA